MLLRYFMKRSRVVAISELHCTVEIKKQKKKKKGKLWAVIYLALGPNESCVAHMISTF